MSKSEQGASPLNLLTVEGTLHAVIESLPFDFFLIGLDGRYVLQNSVCREHGGDVIGKRPEDIAPTAELRALWAKNNARAFTGQTVRDEVSFERNGELRHFLNIVAPIQNEGRVVGIAGVNIDVTDRKRLAEEHEKADRLESLGTLAGGIAHDFNNLLTGVLGLVSLCKDEQEQQSRSYALLEKSEKACARAQTLTQQLLTFAKGGEPVRRSASLRDILTETADFVLSGSNCRSEMVIADDLWPVAFDRGQIGQVVQNVIMNATQAMPNGGLVRIHAANVGKDDSNHARRWVEVVVTDHGGGMTLEVLRKVFEPYFSTRRDGRGLGLAVVDSIVKRHDGSIHIDSQENRGTIVRIKLPAENGEVDPATFAVPVTSDAEATGGRILILEDDPINADVFVQIFERCGYHPVLARSSDEATVVFEQHCRDAQPFEFAVLDLTIRGGPGGVECLQRLRRLDPKLTAVVTSGYSDDPVLAEPQQFGFNSVLRKPFSVADVALLIADLAKGKR